jgi:hypothetical protein
VASEDEFRRKKGGSSLGKLVSDLLSQMHKTRHYIPSAKEAVPVFTLLFDFWNHFSGLLLSPELSFWYCDFEGSPEAASTCMLEIDESSSGDGGCSETIERALRGWTSETDSAAGFRRGFGPGDARLRFGDESFIAEMEAWYGHWPLERLDYRTMLTVMYAK